MLTTCATPSKTARLITISSRLWHALAARWRRRPAIHEGRECAAERELILRDIDTNSKLRFSHENPSVVECYEKYFGEPNSEKAEQLLHSDHFAWGMPAARQQ